MMERLKYIRVLYSAACNTVYMYIRFSYEVYFIVSHTSHTYKLLSYIVMLILISTGIIELWHIYTTAFCLGLGMAINQPLRTSFIPQMVGKEHMLKRELEILYILASITFV